MKNDLEETIIAGLMCNQPVIIVEGQDDIKFYDNIATLNELKVDVRAVETIDGYTEGCEQVCNAMNEVAILVQKDSRLKKYAMGIIDRDVRQYLNTLPEIDNLLVLKYYSYEMHLITDRTIKRLLEQLTMAPASLITQNVVEMLKQQFHEQSMELYYFSLEALKKMCERTYGAGISYGIDGGAVIGRGKQYRWGLISTKTGQLDQFATMHNISRSDLKYIVKGKWFLFSWCDFLIKTVKLLHRLCAIQLPQCEYCKAGQKHKCLWRQSSSFQVPEIISLLHTQQFIDLDEVKYISDYMKEHLAC